MAFVCLIFGRVVVKWIIIMLYYKLARSGAAKPPFFAIILPYFAVCHAPASVPAKPL